MDNLAMYDKLYLPEAEFDIRLIVETKEGELLYAGSFENLEELEESGLRKADHAIDKYIDRKIDQDLEEDYA